VIELARDPEGILVGYRAHNANRSGGLGIADPFTLCELSLDIDPMHSLDFNRSERGFLALHQPTSNTLVPCRRGARLHRQTNILEPVRPCVLMRHHSVDVESILVR
jgi:hypothetical protein